MSEIILCCSVLQCIPFEDHAPPLKSEIIQADTADTLQHDTLQHFTKHSQHTPNTLQHAATCCNTKSVAVAIQHIPFEDHAPPPMSETIQVDIVCCTVMQFVAVNCSVLHCAVCCNAHPARTTHRHLCLKFFKSSFRVAVWFRCVAIYHDHSADFWEFLCLHFCEKENFQVDLSCCSVLQMCCDIPWS